MVEKEIQFKSQVHVDHHRTLKEKEDARRRRSQVANAKLRQNHREGQEKMRLAAIEEDRALYEERYESSLAFNGSKATNAKKKRESFAFRNGDARRIRELHSKMEKEKLTKEHESWELKWAGERDAEEYKRQLAQQRRESLAGRNAVGRQIREVEQKMREHDQIREHESYELKWAGERDADEYKRQLAQQRRKSLAGRNAEGRQIREVEQKMREHDQAYEHESYELKWDGERDADEYKRQLAQQRRESLAGRNAEGRQIRDLESIMKADDQAREHESYELKWAGERDADEYKRQLAQERRESLAFRNAEGHRIRDLKSTMKADDQAREHESYELKWAGERDADEYKRQMAQERRESLAGRNAEAARHDAVMKELRSLALDKEHESYMLKWAGENDAKEYLAEQQELRRQSLEFRNAEGRRHRQIEEDTRAAQVQDNARNEELSAAGKQHVCFYNKYYVINNSMAPFFYLSSSKRCE